MEKDDLKFIYNTIIYQIDKTDTKANFLLILQTAIIGYFLTRLDYLKFLNIYIAIILVVATISTILTLLFIMKTIWPRLSSSVLDTQNSLIYFRHILSSFKKDKEKLLKKFEEYNLKELNNDLANQIISISHLALNKYKYIHKAIIFLIFQIGLLILLFALSYIFK